jgi:V/A-type H+/Na+-transporting ATPase subunit E
MGIEKLRGSLLSEAQEDAQKMIKDAQDQATKIEEEERGKRSTLKKDAEGEVERMLGEQRNERLAWARLESKRVMSEAREDAIREVLESFLDALKGARKTPEYKKYLAKAVAQACSELGSGAIIHIAKGDKSLLGPIKSAKVVEDLDGLGGARIESSSGKMLIDMTLETLFESRKDDIRKMIYDKLFGEK